MAGIVLNVEKREKVGASGARATRGRNLIPGVLYGGARGAIPIALQEKEVETAIRSGKFLSHMVEIDHKGERQPVIPRAVQFHPVSDKPIHIDLYRVEENAIIAIDVVVHFKNHDASPGLKRGGVLNIVRHDIEMYCPAGAIPDFIEASLAGYEIGGSVHISKVKLPDNCKPAIADRDFTIATIAGSMAMKPEDEDKPAVAAGEVPALAQKAPEGEAAAAGAKDAKGAPPAGGKDAKAAAPAKDAKAPAKGDKK